MRCLGLCVAMLLASSACSGQGNRQEKRTPPAASGLSETELNSLAEKAPYSSVVAPRGSGGLGIDGYWHGKFFLKALTLAGKSTFAEKLFRSPGSDQFYRQLAGPDLARGLITVGQVNAAATILKEAETDAARNDYLSGLGEVGLLWAEASRPDDLSRIVEFCRAFASSRKLYPAHLDQMGAVAGALVNSGRLQEAEAFVDFLRGKGDLSSVRYSVLTPYGRALASAGPSERALAVAKELDESKRAEVLQPLVERLASNGKLDEARLILEAIPSSNYPDYRGRAVGFLAGALGRQNRTDEGRSLVQSHKQISKRDDSGWSSTILYELAPYSAKVGNGELSAAMLQEASGSKDAVDAYAFFRVTRLTEVSETLVYGGLSSEATKTLEEARKIASQIPREEIGDKQKPQYAEAQARIARVLVRLHRYREARSLADTLVSLVPNKQGDALSPVHRAWVQAWQLYTYSIILIENAIQTNGQLRAKLEPNYL